MLQMIRHHARGMRYPVIASLSLSFALMGDAFLYPFLPQHPGMIGAPAVWVGFLLSVNRFVRIVFNRATVLALGKFGIRNVALFATVLAVLSTAGYGFGWGLISLIIFRIIWGIAYAALRINAMAYAFEYENLGFALGLSRSIQELGPVFAVWACPIVLSHFNGNVTFLFLAMLSIPSILYAVRLPELNYVPAAAGRSGWRLPGLFNSLTFLENFIVEGMLVVTLGVFIGKNHPGFSVLMITSVAAGYLAFRRISFILFSPFGGALADRIGFNRIFIVSLSMVSLGLVFLLMGWEVVGLILLFAFNSVNSALAPRAASDREVDKIKAVAENATWRDIGAAAGALVGGLLLSANGLLEVFGLTTGVLVVLLLVFIKRNHNRK